MKPHYPAVIAQRRTALGLTQHELGLLVGVSRSQIRRYEAGESVPTFERAHRLTIALQVPYELLFQDAIHEAKVFVVHARQRLEGY